MAKNLMRVIRGDLLEYVFVMDGIYEDMLFTCIGQGICSHLPYSEEHGGYVLRLTSAQTAHLAPKKCWYDLTGTLKDGSKLTVIYRGTFAVSQKPVKIREV